MIALLALLACSPTPLPSPDRTSTVDSVAPVEPGPADRVRELAEAEGWTVSEGAFVFSTMEYCCEAGVTCLGNNPSTPYGLVALPPGPGQTVSDIDTFWMWGPIGQGGLSRTYRLRSNEVVLLIGEAPPASKYLSIRSSIGTRYDGDTGQRELVLGSVGPTTNNLTLEAQQPGFWGQPIAVTSAADALAEQAVTDWVVEAGLAADQVHHDRIAHSDVKWGWEAEADSMMIAARVAVSDDPAAMDAYEADPPLRALRLTPPPGTPTSPMPREELPQRGAGADESAWAGALEELEDAIAARFSHMQGFTATVTPAFSETFDCIVEGGCIGDVRDRLAARTGSMVLEDGDAIVIYGVNHERTGRTLYSNFAMMVDDNWVGAAAVDSAQMVGSARAWLGDTHPQVDDLYAWILARDCSPYTEPCLEVQSQCPWPEPHESFFVTFRMYLDPATGAAPLEDEILVDRLVRFIPPATP